MSSVFVLLALLCGLYTLVLVARVILDLVINVARDWQPTGALLILANSVFRITDPPLRLLSKVIPPLRFGGIQLDLGFLVLFIVIQMLQRVFLQLA